MTTTDAGPALREALRRTLEDLCFVMPDPDAGDGSGLPVQAAALVRFAGPIRGAVVLRLRGDALGTIVSDMLGTSDAPTAADERDCMAEIANVACGTLLPLLGDERAVYDVLPPEVATEVELGAPGEPSGAACVGFDGGALQMSLYVEVPPEAT